MMLSFVFFITSILCFFAVIGYALYCAGSR